MHAHLHLPDFNSDLDNVIQRAEQAGVKAIITNGLNIKSNKLALKLSDKFKIIKPALGIHPTEINKVADIQNIETEFADQFKHILENKEKIVAVGEIGLDFKFSNAQSKQIALFQKLIELAKKINKPIIVHSRNAEKEVIDILESLSIKDVVLHCFCGKFKFVKRGIDNGWFFSIPANINRSLQFQDLAKKVPLSQLLTETDSPLLSPNPGQRNDPSNILHSVKKIAELRKLKKEYVALNIYQNYQQLFES